MEAGGEVPPLRDWFREFVDHGDEGHEHIDVIITTEDGAEHIICISPDSPNLRSQIERIANLDNIEEVRLDIASDGHHYTIVSDRGNQLISRMQNAVNDILATHYRPVIVMGGDRDAVLADLGFDRERNRVVFDTFLEAVTNHPIDARLALAASEISNVARLGQDFSLFALNAAMREMEQFYARDHIDVPPPIILQRLGEAVEMVVNNTLTGLSELPENVIPMVFQLATLYEVNKEESKALLDYWLPNLLPSVTSPLDWVKSFFSNELPSVSSSARQDHMEFVENALSFLADPEKTSEGWQKVGEFKFFSQTSIKALNFIKKHPKLNVAFTGMLESFREEVNRDPELERNFSQTFNTLKDNVGQVKESFSILKTEIEEHGDEEVCMLLDNLNTDSGIQLVKRSVTLLDNEAMEGVMHAQSTVLQYIRSKVAPEDLHGLLQTVNRNWGHVERVGSAVLEFGEKNPILTNVACKYAGHAADLAVRGLDAASQLNTSTNEWANANESLLESFIRNAGEEEDYGTHSDYLENRKELDASRSKSPTPVVQPTPPKKPSNPKQKIPAVEKANEVYHDTMIHIGGWY